MRLAHHIFFCVHGNIPYLLHFSKRCLAGNIQRKLKKNVRQLLFVRNHLKRWHQGLLISKCHQGFFMMVFSCRWSHVCWTVPPGVQSSSGRQLHRNEQTREDCPCYWSLKWPRAGPTEVCLRSNYCVPLFAAHAVKRQSASAILEINRWTACSQAWLPEKQLCVGNAFGYFWDLVFRWRK